MNRIPANRFVLFLALAVIILAADLCSKSIIFADLGYPGSLRFAWSPGVHRLFTPAAGQEGESVPYIDGWVTFRLLTSFNPGALWGVGQKHTSLFAALSFCAVIGIPVWLFCFKAAGSMWLTVALALIFGGTLGNLYDRVGLHGCADSQGTPVLAVRDFLLFEFGSFHWPVFNLADVSLVTGASMLIVHSLAPASAGTRSDEAGPIARADHPASVPAGQNASLTASASPREPER
jgi:signal peptidase II